MTYAKDIPRDRDLIQTISNLRSPKTMTDDGWINIGDISDEISPAWQNGWGNGVEGVPTSFFLDPDGIVHFRGSLAGGTLGTVAFTLPVGFRPEHPVLFLGGGTALGSGISKIQVDTNGDVIVISSGNEIVDGDVTGTFPASITLKPGANGFWKTVAGVLTRVTTVAWSELTGIPSTFAPSAHNDSHATGGSDAFSVSDLLDAIARVSVRKNSAGSVFSRRRINLIEGANVTLTVADDSGNEEVDVTIASSGGGGIDVTDGITTVSPSSKITFTSGAVVTNAGGGDAHVAISGGGGSPDDVNMVVGIEVFS